MVEGVRLRPASGIALRRPGAGFTAALNGQEVGDFDPARGGGFCPANGEIEAEKIRRIGKERAKKVLRDKNHLIKTALKDLENAGRLSELDAVMAQVFPGISTSYSARSTAYAGCGSKALRVCIAAIAFGKPPALVWEEGEGKGAVRQPGVDSEEWKALIAHPGFQLPLGSEYHN